MRRMLHYFASLHVRKAIIIFQRVIIKGNTHKHNLISPLFSMLANTPGSSSPMTVHVNASVRCYFITFAPWHLLNLDSYLYELFGVRYNHQWCQLMTQCAVMCIFPCALRCWISGHIWYCINELPVTAPVVYPVYDFLPFKTSITASLIPSIPKTASHSPEVPS